MAGAQMLLDEVFPLFARGCLGYGSSQIGTFLAASGAAVPVGALLSPYTIHRLGELRAFFIVNAASLVLGIAIPFVALGLPAETSTLVLYCCYFATRVPKHLSDTRAASLSLVCISRLLFWRVGKACSLYLVFFFLLTSASLRARAQFLKPNPLLLLFSHHRSRRPSASRSS